MNVTSDREDMDGSRSVDTRAQAEGEVDMTYLTNERPRGREQLWETT